MNLEWISQKGAGLMAIVVGLLFIAFAILQSQYMIFYVCVAVAAFIYSFRQFRKRVTPFEKRERELRRKVM
jgi:4-hydroxybenzoate polyprenyltransferase